MDLRDLQEHAPGLVGSLSALIFLRAPVPRLAGFVAAGWAASYFLAPSVSRWLGAGVDDGASVGFLVGLLSMALAAKVFDVIEAVRPGELVERLLKRWGL